MDSKPMFPNPDIEAGFREAAESAFNMPVVLSYDGPMLPTVATMPVFTISAGTGRKSRRTARLTARYLRAAAKREEKP